MIQSLERAFMILEVLDAASLKNNGLGAQAISDAVGLKFPTAHNIIKSLVELGYVEQDQNTKRYRLSAKCRQLGRNGNPKELLLKAGTPVMESLAREFDETALLTMLLPDQRREVVAESLSSQELKVSSKLGIPLDDLYRRVTGRFMLSNMCDDELEAYWKSHGVPAAALWKELKTVKDLRVELAKIRKLDVLKQLDVDAIAVASPVFVPELGINAALGCAFPVCRSSERKLAAIEAAVAARAKELLAILSPN